MIHLKKYHAKTNLERRGIIKMKKTAKKKRYGRICVSCHKEVTDKTIDKTRSEYKINPVCKSCSEELYRAFNGD